MKPVFLILCLVSLLFAGFDSKRAGENISPWTDTASITNLHEAGTVRYTTTCWDVSGDEPLRLIVMVNDTDAAGFSNDSMKLQWGYQTGSRVLNASGTLDTIWYNRVTVDTVDAASYGAATVGTISAVGTPTMVTAKESDTSSVTGYAVQSRPVNQCFDEIVRCWANGLTGQNKTAIKLKFLLKSRIYAPVRGK